MFLLWLLSTIFGECLRGTGLKILSLTQNKTTANYPNRLPRLILIFNHCDCGKERERPAESLFSEVPGAFEELQIASCDRRSHQSPSAPMRAGIVSYLTGERSSLPGLCSPYIPLSVPDIFSYFAPTGIVSGYLALFLMPAPKMGPDICLEANFCKNSLFCVCVVHCKAGSLEKTEEYHNFCRRAISLPSLYFSPACVGEHPGILRASLRKRGGAGPWEQSHPLASPIPTPTCLSSP